MRYICNQISLQPFAFQCFFYCILQSVTYMIDRLCHFFVITDQLFLINLKIQFSTGNSCQPIPDYLPSCIFPNQIQQYDTVCQKSHQKTKAGHRHNKEHISQNQKDKCSNHPTRSFSRHIDILTALDNGTDQTGLPHDMTFHPSYYT